MTDDRGTDDLAPYLRAGPDQRGLLRAMDRGHARIQHGEQLGNPSSEVFMGRIARHLQKAPEAYAVDSYGFRCYLLVDRRNNQVAWIPPHKPHRATFFQPDDGIADYLASTRAVLREGSMTPIDVVAVRRRAVESSRQPARGISSVQRSAPSTALDR